MGIIDDSETVKSRSVLMGATPEIHDDMMYDYATRRERMMPRRFDLATGGANVSVQEDF